MAALMRFELGGELLERHCGGVELDVALVVDRDGLHLWPFERLRGGRAATGKIHLHALHARGRHDDEDQQQHEVEVHHRRDVDVIVGFVVGVHGGAVIPCSVRPSW
jgi:hypothetical protein